MLQFQAGQMIKCTLTAKPRSDGARCTVERLMRLSPANRKSLRRAQLKRSQRVNRFNRGYRWWISREEPAKIAVATSGAVWTMRYMHDLAGDFASVAKYLKIEAA